MFVSRQSFVPKGAGRMRRWYGMTTTTTIPARPYYVHAEPMGFTVRQAMGIAGSLVPNSAIAVASLYR
jgi:hypothetical protein